VTAGNALKRLSLKVTAGMKPPKGTSFDFLIKDNTFFAYVINSWAVVSGSYLYCRGT